MARRWAVFLAGLAASVALTAALWAAGFPGFFLFLLFPLLWLPFGRRSGGPQAETPSCPSCGQPMQPGFAFCPSCGSRL